MREEVKRELEQFSDISATQLVAVAKRRRGGPLYLEFERYSPGVWSDAKAAQKHREQVARQILRDYRVVVTVHDVAADLEVRGFVHDPDVPDGEQRYVPSSALQNDPRRANAVLATEAKRARSVLTTVANLATYWRVDHADVDLAIQNIGDFIESLEAPQPRPRRQRPSQGRRPQA
jgi:hypothetical protein